MGMAEGTSGLIGDGGVGVIGEGTNLGMLALSCERSEMTKGRRHGAVGLLTLGGLLLVQVCPLCSPPSAASHCHSTATVGVCGSSGSVAEGGISGKCTTDCLLVYGWSFGAH